VGCYKKLSVSDEVARGSRKVRGLTCTKKLVVGLVRGGCNTQGSLRWLALVCVRKVQWCFAISKIFVVVLLLVQILKKLSKRFGGAQG